MGATPKAQQVEFGVLLHMRNQAGAVRALQAVSDPASASYGEWLTNAQFNARYAPAHRVSSPCSAGCARRDSR